MKRSRILNIATALAILTSVATLITLAWKQSDGATYIAVVIILWLALNWFVRTMMKGNRQ